MALLAALPILAVLGLMLGLGWSALRAGGAGLGLCVLLAIGAFAPGAELGLPVAAVGIGAEAGFLALGILWILWPALALYRYQLASGAFERLRTDLPALVGGGALPLLLVGLLLALFLEGAAGFGTPVALAAPLLVGLGVRPVPAVALALVGHAGAVAFGALGTPVLAQAALTGLPAAHIAVPAASLQLALGAVLLFGFRRLLAVEGVRLPLGWLLLAGYGFLLSSLLLVWLAGPALGSFGAALMAIGLLLAAVRLGPPLPAVAGLPGRLLPALLPYLLLILLVATSRLLPLGEAGVLAWEWAGRYRGRIALLQHPGTLMMLALLGTALLQRRAGAPLRVALLESARLLRPVALALLVMLLLSRLMLDAGMVAALQQAAVLGLGAAWPLLAPALGALGSFVTGSATASNVLFSSLQAGTAQGLGLPPAWLLAGQTLGAAVGNIICPHNVVAGAATVGLAGREAEIIRRTLPVCLLYLALAGGLLWGLLASGLVG
ncbi:MAG: L-lactate permease [Aquimonas sp.]|nr:L-lactate permease [Aquimonas sp.]